MRVYTVPISGNSPAAAFDLLEINPAAGKPICLLRLTLFTSEPIAEEEPLAMSIVRGYTTSGSGGSAVTPQPCNPSDAAAGFTCEVLNTTQASTGGNVIFEGGINTRQGGDVPLAPEEVLEAASRLVIQIAAPADAVPFRGTAWIGELG